MTGLTDDVLAKIKARDLLRQCASTAGRKSGKPTQLYQSISIMKEFRLDPASWNSLSRLDKKILHYHRIMEGHYMDQISEKQDRETKMTQQKQEFLNKLPQQMPKRR